MREKKTMKEKKTILTFIAILAGSMLLGFAVGFFGDRVNGMLKAMDTTQLVNGLSFGLTIFFVLFHLILCVIAFTLYGRSKKAYDQRSENDEEIIDRIEYQLDLPMLLGNLAIVVNLVLFSVNLYLDKIGTLEKTHSLTLLMVNLLAFIFGYVWIITLQHKLVNFCKEINPEKEGNIFDTKFQKVWVGSCDEAQKMMIYQSAYKAFNAANVACSICWVISFFGMLMFDAGILAVVMIGVVYLTLIMSYTVAAMKMEKPTATDEKL